MARALQTKNVVLRIRSAKMEGAPAKTRLFKMVRTVVPGVS